MPINVPLRKTGTIPADQCFTTLDAMASTLTGVLAGRIEGDSIGLIISRSAPSPANEDKAWLKLDNDFGPERLYRFWNGLWVSRHPVPFSGLERRIWVGDLAQLKTYDDGEDAPVSDVTGPFWVEDSDFAARFLVGAGTFAGGTVVGHGDAGGAEEVQLAEANIPEHRHSIGIDGSGVDEAAENGRLRVGAGTEIGFQPDTSEVDVAHTRTYGGDEDGATVPVPILPPYRGVYIIRRTARVYYVAT
jgi:hypothetical protein